MRKLVLSLLALGLIFGAVQPASAETRSWSARYGRPAETIEFGLQGDETRAELTIIDDMRWNVSAHYRVQTRTCYGGGGYGGETCENEDAFDGYFCRYTSFSLPANAWKISVTVQAPVVNKLYCGTITGGTQGRIYIVTTYTPSGGGGCGAAPAYMRSSRDRSKILDL